jgi:hypothetical protein
MARYEQPEFLRALSSVFWDMTACSLVEVECHFRGMYDFHLQGQRIRPATRKPYYLLHGLLSLNKFKDSFKL